MEIDSDDASVFYCHYASEFHEENVKFLVKSLLQIRGKLSLMEVLADQI